MPDIEQGSAEWFDQRRGKVTASRISDMMAKTKSGWGASRANYMAELAAERLTGVTADSYSNAAMQWGTNTEPLARDAYLLRYIDRDIKEVGFVDHPTVAMSGASPDGLVDDTGLIEIKCPLTKTHIDYLLKQEVPKNYVLQMQWQMACTGTDWCDFVSFDPRMPETLCLFERRVNRDNDQIKELENAVLEFQFELGAMVDQLTNLMRRAA